jgi:transaldolase / glucose-6-phosphate isomerase
MQQLAEAGISMDDVTDTLLKDGAQLFVNAFDQLIGVISPKRAAVLGRKLDRITYSIGAFHSQVDEKLGEFRQTNLIRRVWAQDPTVWHHESHHHQIIRNALGWLRITE